MLGLAADFRLAGRFEMTVPHPLGSVGGASTQPAMKYQIYQTKDDLLHPLREAARFGAAWVRAWDLGCLTPLAIPRHRRGERDICRSQD